jgi:hypothetical protein
VSSAAGLAIGAIVTLGSQQLLEHAVIASITGNDVGLRLPLLRSFAVGTAVGRVTPGATGAAVALASAVERGDGILHTAAALGPGTSVEITDGPLTEYRALNALATADGYYAIDGVTGTGSITLKASAGALTAQSGWTVDYSRPVNVVDFRVS